jgi:pilus assembly protein CpaC
MIRGLLGMPLTATFSVLPLFAVVSSQSSAQSLPPSSIAPILTPVRAELGSAGQPIPLSLYVGQASVLNEAGVRRIAVGNGKIIQATALDARQILLLPESPGQTSLVLWRLKGSERHYTLHVAAADVGQMMVEVRTLLGPLSGIEVRVVGDRVVLEGKRVGEETNARLTEILKRYPQVVNLVQRVGNERMIAMDVRMIEIKRDVLRNIGVRWNGTAEVPSVGVIADLVRSPELRPGGSGQGVAGLDIRPKIAGVAGAIGIASSITSMLNYLVQNGDAVVLAEPRLSCRSGGSARFVAGGELPIPYSSAVGHTTVNFKEYGIKFDVSPVAGDDGMIAARIATELSAIDFGVVVREVPGLSKRRAVADVNLRVNETFIIAGLLTDDIRNAMDRGAGMGDLPVLGALFRSKLFRDQKTELAVLITPSFMDGIDEPSKLRVRQDLERVEQTRQRAKITLERYRMLD